MSTTQRFSNRSIAQLFLMTFILLIMVAPLPFAAPAHASSGVCAGLDWETGPPGGANPPVPTIGGTVTDSSGAGVANTSVSLIRCVGTQTISFETGVTNLSGDYSFTNLPTTYAYVISLDDVSSYPQYLDTSALDIDFVLGQ